MIPGTWIRPNLKSTKHEIRSFCNFPQVAQSEKYHLGIDPVLPAVLERCSLIDILTLQIWAEVI